MPLARYSRHFGGQRDAPARVLSKMQARYGDEKGKQVFYATVNKRRGSRDRGRGLTNVMRGRRKQ